MKVYIAYTRRGGEIIARQLSDLLKKADIEVLGYFDIVAGENWSVSIANSILAADLVVALITENAPQSRYFVNEVRSAVSYSKKIVPVVFDDFFQQRRVLLHRRVCRFFQPPQAAVALEHHDPHRRAVQ